MIMLTGAFAFADNNMSLVRGYSDSLAYSKSTLDQDLDKSEVQAIERAFEQCDSEKPMHIVAAYSNSDLETTTSAYAKVYCSKKQWYQTLVLNKIKSGLLCFFERQCDFCFAHKH